MAKIPVAPVGGGGGGFVFGEYAGNAKDAGSQDIDLGFQPSLVIVGGKDALYGNYTNSSVFAMAMLGFPVSNTLEITETGFLARQTGASTYNGINHAGLTYRYVAFR